MVKPPLFVKLIVFAPALAAVQVNVAVGVPLEMLTVAGVKVQPVAAGVMTTVPVIAPLADAVKLDEAKPAVPVLGPETAIAVAAALDAV